MNPRPIMLVSGHVRPVPGDLPVGGAARQAVKLSRALRVRGVEARILTYRPRLRYPRHELVDGVPVCYVDSLYWLLRYRGVRRLEAVLRVGVLVTYLARHRREYDVIHIHTAATATALAGVLAGRWLRKPTVLKITNSGERYDLHRFYKGSGLPAARWLGGLLRSVSCVVALNEEAFDQLVADGFHPQQIIHIPNGVNVDRIQPKSSYGTAGSLNILYTGRLHSSKGLEVLLEALALLPQAPTWHCALVGTGPAHAALVQRTVALGLQKQVTFTGELADVSPYLEQADVFVLPSRTEGISNALLEAMAAGLPCVGTDNAGNRRILTHGETGLLVALDDAEALTDSLASLLANARLRERLGRAGRHLVETRFNVTRVAGAYLAVYRRLTDVGALANGSVIDRRCYG
jgi:glycosyltransferase involved in cell wall biosynthesis